MPACRLTLRLLIGEEFRPDIALLFPGRILHACDLELRDVELAVSVNTDVLHFGTAELQHLTPGASFDRHAEAAQADAAAITLVEDGEIEEAGEEKEPEPDERGVVAVPEEQLPVDLGDRITRRPGIVDLAQENRGDSAAQRQLQRQ